MRLAPSTLLLTSLALCCLLGGMAARAADEVLLSRREGNLDKQPHSEQVLREALRRTQNKYGEARIRYASSDMPRERVLIEMIKGSTINVSIVATQPSWELSTLPVWVPVDMGLSSYRIGFIHQTEQARLSTVHSVEDLQKIVVGVGLGWSSRKVLEANHLTLQTAKDQTALTRMLLARRLDYFPRGVNEIFNEYDNMADRPPELAVESDLLLAFPLPTYIFVSPAAPRLARRITEGLDTMVRDGSLLKLVIHNHRDMLERAKLCQRRILRLENPLLTPDNPVNNKALWFDPFDKKARLCPPGQGSRK